MSAKDNPFATGRLEKLLAFRPEWIGMSWDAIRVRWDELGHRACVIGHHGSGKTTFLDAFEGRIDMQVIRLFFNDEHHRLCDEEMALLSDVSGKCLMVDGGTHLRRKEWAQVIDASESAAAFVCTQFRKRELPVLIELQSDLDLARKILNQADPVMASQLEEQLPKMLKKHRGNLRELLLECYDLWKP